MGERAIPIEIIGTIEDVDDIDPEEILDVIQPQLNGKPPMSRSRSGSRNRSSLNLDDLESRSNRASLIITHEDGTVEENPATVERLSLSIEDIPSQRLTIEEYLSPAEDSHEETVGDSSPWKPEKTADYEKLESPTSISKLESNNPTAKLKSSPDKSKLESTTIHIIVPPNPRLHNIEITEIETPTTQKSQYHFGEYHSPSFVETSRNTAEYPSAVEKLPKPLDSTAHNYPSDESSGLVPPQAAESYGRRISVETQTGPFYDSSSQTSDEVFGESVLNTKLKNHCPDSFGAVIAETHSTAQQTEPSISDCNTIQPITITNSEKSSQEYKNCDLENFRPCKNVSLSPIVYRKRHASEVNSEYGEIKSLSSQDGEMSSTSLGDLAWSPQPTENISRAHSAENISREEIETHNTSQKMDLHETAAKEDTNRPRSRVMNVPIQLHQNSTFKEASRKISTNEPSSQSNKCSAEPQNNPSQPSSDQTMSQNSESNNQIPLGLDKKEVRMIPITLHDGKVLEANSETTKSQRMPDFMKSETETPGVKPESVDASLSIPIQLENGEVIKPVFTDLKELVPPTWSVFHNKGEKERVVPINLKASQSPNSRSEPSPTFNASQSTNGRSVPSPTFNASQSTNGRSVPSPTFNASQSTNGRSAPSPSHSDQKSSADPKSRKPSLSRGISPDKAAFFKESSPAYFSEMVEERKVEERMEERCEEITKQNSSTSFNKTTWSQSPGLSRKSPFSSSSAVGAIPKTQDYHRKSPQRDILAEKASPKSSKKSGGLNNAEEHKIFDKFDSQRRSSEKETLFSEDTKKAPFADKKDSDLYPNVTSSSKSEFITSRAEFVSETQEMRIPVGPEEKTLETKPTKPPSGPRNIPIRKSDKTDSKRGNIGANLTQSQSREFSRPKQRSYSSDRSSKISFASDREKMRSVSVEESASVKKETLDTLKKVQQELEAARIKLDSHVDDLTAGLSTSKVPIIPRLNPESLPRSFERSRSVESERQRSTQKQSRYKAGRDRSLQDIDKDIETIWRELQELDKLPIDPVEDIPKETSGLYRPPSAPPTLSNHALITPPWRNRTASGNTTSEKNIYRTSANIRDKTNSQPRTIWDPINTRYSGEFPAKYPATPTSTQPLSSSWDAKPNYFPTSSNSHFSFLPKAETKPGYITPSYISTSPRTIHRTVPILQQADIPPGSSARAEFLGESRSRPEAWSSPVNQDGRQEITIGRAGRTTQQGVRPLPRDPSTGQIRIPNSDNLGYPSPNRNSQDVTSFPTTPPRTRHPIPTLAASSKHAKSPDSRFGYQGAAGLKSCLKADAKPLNKPADQNRQNVLFKKTDAVGATTEDEPFVSDYDWVDIDKQGEVKSRPKSSISSTTQTKSESPLRIKINRDSTESTETPLNVKINRSETGSKNPFLECEDCCDKKALNTGADPTSPCDACTQTEKIKKQNCRVM